VPPNIFTERYSRPFPTVALRLDRQFNPATGRKHEAGETRDCARWELCVVVDSRDDRKPHGSAHYVLPASSQFEKTEFTRFQIRDFRRTILTVVPVYCRRPPETLPEHEITRGLAVARGLLPGDNVSRPCGRRRRRSRAEFDHTHFVLFIGGRKNPRSVRSCPGAITYDRGDTRQDGTAPRLYLGNARWLERSERRQAVRRALGASTKVGGSSARRYPSIRRGRPEGTAVTRHDYDEVWS